jgi:hypothetical protein
MPANPLGAALRNRRAGHHTLVWARPDLQAPENFTLTSPAFDHEAPIPERHRGRLLRANISPALNWTQPPAGTAELGQRHNRDGFERGGWTQSQVRCIEHAHQSEVDGHDRPLR